VSAATVALLKARVMELTIVDMLSLLTKNISNSSMNNKNKPLCVSSPCAAISLGRGRQSRFLWIRFPLRGFHVASLPAPCIFHDILASKPLERDAGFFCSIEWVIDNAPRIVIPNRGVLVRFDSAFFVKPTGPQCFADQ
jgi:hypothetical protein